MLSQSFTYPALSYYIAPVTSFKQNCTLLVCNATQDALLIDPGGFSDALATLIAQQQLHLKYILLTHGHLDHVGAAAVWSKRYDVPIYGPHAADTWLFENLTTQAHHFGLPEPLCFFPDAWLNSTSTLALGKLNLTVHHTPGHTPGHLCYALPAANLLWTGDLLFHGSVGRTDFPRGDASKLLQSLQYLLQKFPKETLFIPGHGPRSSLQIERRTNSYLAGLKDQELD